jgi:ElaB/YqjD/DUF883 family membrane-anchored ribosome-binding protein
MENTVEEEPFDIRNHIINSIQEFQNTLDQMQKCRNDLASEKAAKIKAKKDLKRTEKLFKTKLEGLNKKPEFKSTIPSQ